MTEILRDVDRRNINVSTSKVKEVLPEYFQGEYPALVTFLEKYYEFLDSDASGAFKRQINDLFAVRDISQTSENNLDQIVNEVGNGLQVASFFQSPRLMARLLPLFYNSKGTLVSAEAFFRAFFNEEATIEYPKDQIFIVGESEIGYESQKFIQDAGIYQIFSILVKVGLSVSDYQNLYTRFVHPAGWHFQGQVATEGNVVVGVLAQSEDPLDSAGAVILASEVDIDTRTEFSELTALIDSDGQNIRVSVDQNLLSKYQDLTIEELNRYYENVAEIMTPNSFTFDDDSDGSARPDTAITLETMDNSMFTRYLSDSAI